MQIILTLMLVLIKTYIHSEYNIIYFPFEKQIRCTFFTSKDIKDNEFVFFTNGHWYVAENLKHYEKYEAYDIDDENAYYESDDIIN